MVPLPGTQRIVGWPRDACSNTENRVVAAHPFVREHALTFQQSCRKRLGQARTLPIVALGVNRIGMV